MEADVAVHLSFHGQEESRRLISAVELPKGDSLRRTGVKEFSLGDESSRGKQYGILGIPWDGGASLGRPGARYGPGKVREALSWIVNRIQDQRLASIEKQTIINLNEVCIRDFGDVDIVYHDYEETFSNITSIAREILGQGFIPLVIGGDHSISFPLIRALQSHIEGNIGIIQFDAHLDLLDQSVRQGRFSHSSEIRRAIELERVSAGNLVQIGVRGFNYPDNWEFIRSNNIKQFTPQLIRNSRLDEIVEHSIEIASKGAEKIYMTVDIDVLDPAYAPGCGANEPGGLTVAEVESLLDKFSPHVDFLDIVEVNPIFDINDMTAAVAAKLLVDFIVSGALAK
jgi:formiminoglutamase/agmatinase